VSAGEAMSFPCEPDCSYYLIVDAESREVIVAVEAHGDEEARKYFEALRAMLSVAPQARVSVRRDETQPPNVPVFRLAYLSALQASVEEEGKAAGVTRH
jgi:hypothetical protein